MIEDLHDSNEQQLKKAIVQVPAVLHRIIRIDSSDQNVQIIFLRGFNFPFHQQII